MNNTGDSSIIKTVKGTQTQNTNTKKGWLCMKFEFFSNCTTLEDVKKVYRDLCFKYHPDITHDNGEKMKYINVEYEKAFQYFKNNNSTYNATKKETFETPEQFKEVINSLVNMQGINIDIVGCFIWLSGNTYPYKERLKVIGFKWAKQKKCWYWHTPEYKQTKHKPIELDDIKAKYGCQRISTKKQVCFNS